MREAGRFTLTRQHVWRWENDEVVPKSWLEPLARALRVDVDVLRAAARSVQAELSPRSEAVAFHAARELITRQQWNGIIDGACQDVWLYGMAEYRYAYDDAVPGHPPRRGQSRLRHQSTAAGSWFPRG